MRPALVLALLVLAGCAPQRAPARGQNVLLVTIDTLRHDRLGCYGDAQALTPVLDRLARSARRFERAYAHNVVTLPSHCNILSGRYPVAHGVHDNAGDRLPRDVETLATLLNMAGYRTGAFVSAFPLDARFGLARGFDEYDDRLGSSEAAFRIAERPGSETVAAARRFVAANASPWFAWVHVYEPHAPYAPPAPLAARFASDPYRGEVAAADAALAPLLNPILDQGAAARTVVIVTADHGEALGEHGERTHGVFAYDATLRVPLLLYAPGVVAAGVDTRLARHVDLLPTVADLLGLATPAGLPGRSLLRSVPADPDSYFEALTASRNRGWAPLHGLVAGGLKYFDLPERELYDLARDPGETDNRIASGDVERLQQRLDRERAGERAAEPQAESVETRERLASLGYVVAPRASSPGAPDPKRMIWFESALDAVIEREQSGDSRGALALAEALLARAPATPLALQYAGYFRRADGDLAGAARALEQAFAMAPSDPQIAALAGQYLTEAGRAAEAAQLLEPLAARADPDVDVLVARGAALAQSGQLDAALGELGRARDLDPENALVVANQGTAHLLAGDRTTARAAFEEALRLEPGLARAENALAVIAAESGRTDEAAQRWERALRSHPGDLDMRLNLARLLLGEGRLDEARPHLERFRREAPAALYAADLRHVDAWLRSKGGGHGR